MIATLCYVDEKNIVIPHLFSGFVQFYYNVKILLFLRKSFGKRKIEDIFYKQRYIQNPMSICTCICLYQKERKGEG